MSSIRPCKRERKKSEGSKWRSQNMWAKTMVSSMTEKGTRAAVEIRRDLDHGNNGKKAWTLLPRQDDVFSRFEYIPQMSKPPLNDKWLGKQRHTHAVDHGPCRWKAPTLRTGQSLHHGCFSIPRYIAEEEMGEVEHDLKRKQKLTRNAKGDSAKIRDRVEVINPDLQAFLLQDEDGSGVGEESYGVITRSRRPVPARPGTKAA